MPVSDKNGPPDAALLFTNFPVRLLSGCVLYYSDKVGVLWCSFAEYYIRAGQSGRARDIYEEAVISVEIVRDFSQIFDACAAFEERNTAARMNNLAEPSNEEDEL